MKKDKVVKALHRTTIIGKGKEKVEEEIIEMTIFIDENEKTSKELEPFIIHKVLLDEEGLEYEEIDEKIPFLKESDYIEYLNKRKNI